MNLTAPEQGDIELLRAWSEFSILHQGLNKETAKKYGRILITFRWDTMVEFAEVTEELIVEWLGHGPSGSWGKESRSQALILFYAWAVRHNHLPADPTLDLILGKRRSGRAREIEKGDIEKILAAAKAMDDPRVAPSLALLYFTGVRVGSLVDAEPADVDLVAKEIFWRTAKRNVTYTSPLNDRAVEAVKALMELLDYHPATAARRQTLVGVGEERVRQWLKAACDRAEVKRVTPNQFRHAFATAIASNPNVQVETWVELMGHSGPGEFSKYSQYDRERLHAALANLKFT